MHERLLHLIGTVLLACQFVRAGSNNPSAIPQKVAFIREGQVWTMAADGSLLRQLTHGGDSKWQPEWSSDGTRIVYVINGTVSNPIQSHVVVIGKGGHVLASVAPYSPADGAIKAINYGELIAPGRLGIESHLNPSLAYYQVFDLNTHIPVAGYLGYGFLWSPDATELAHIGWIPHFGPPSTQSEYLQIYDRTIYNPQKESDVHVLSSAQWAPDSRHLALIDRNDTQHTKELIILDIAGDKPVESFLLPESIGLIAGIRWGGRGDLFICGKKQVWHYKRELKQLQPAEEQEQTDYLEMLRIRCSTIQRVDSLRGAVPDFWPKGYRGFSLPPC